MIIGRGMLARAFVQYENDESVIIFASGVSNSQEEDEKEFQREFALVKKTLLEQPDKLFVYFSTCSMYDPEVNQSAYVKHKLNIESYIQKHAKHFLLLRISQILGKSNNTTLVNYLFDKISNNEYFHVWKHSNRNLIALDDVVKIIHYLIKFPENHNSIHHIANKEYISILELVTLMENILQKKAYYSAVEKGQLYEKIPYDIPHVVDAVNIKFDKDYYYKHLKFFCNYYQS